MIIENIFAFLAGAGVALLPFSLEKGWRVIIYIKFREIRHVFCILFPEAAVGTIRFHGINRQIQTAFELSQLDEWKQVERILIQIIHSANISNKETLIKVLGKERTELWLQKYEKWRIESKNIF